MSDRDDFDMNDPKWGGTWDDMIERVVRDPHDPGEYPFGNNPIHRVLNRCVCGHGKLIHFNGNCMAVGCDCHSYMEE